MARIVKRDDPVTLTFDVFDLELSDYEREQLVEDPRAFLTALLDSEQQTVNDLLVASDERFKTLKPDGATATPGGGTHVPTPSTWHCTSPASMRSKWITIIQ